MVNKTHEYQLYDMVYHGAFTILLAY